MTKEEIKWFAEATFPVTTRNGVTSVGISRRELFAVMAMQALLGNHEAASSLTEDNDKYRVCSIKVAAAAIKYADALIEGLNQDEV